MARSERESYASNQQRTQELEERCARIRALNDRLRQLRSGGRIMLTVGVQALGQGAVAHILCDIAAYDGFSQSDDPHGEHDFGALNHDSQRIFWKIDYYDKALEYGSPDPADPDVTARVMTIMLASEY